MGNTRLFEPWTFQRPLPEPFAEVAVRRGKKDTTEDQCLSVHNRMTRGKRATLHGATLRALIAVADIINGKPGALGFQKEQEKIRWYCDEYVKEGGTVPEIRVMVYDSERGRIIGTVQTGKTLSAFQQFGENGGDGKEILMLLAYASIVKGPLFDQEFAAAFLIFCQKAQAGFPDPEDAGNQAFLCCDNLYRRIENWEALGIHGIPFDNDSILSGNIPLLTLNRLQKGDYGPTMTEYGEFQVLKEKSASIIKGTLEELKERYLQKVILTEAERELVPKLPGFYQVPEEVTDIVEAVTETPMRVFMSAGESGTGKTTNAKMVAQLLGLPYYFFTCGEGTDEVDLVSSMIPNIGNRAASPVIQFPSYKDMQMDPASALEQITGVYEDEISEESAFNRIMKEMYQKGYQGGQGEKDYVMVESSIVTGCRRPSVIELQEPSVITKPGTLVKLNGLLDDGAAITLTSGELVKRDPGTVILLTTNMGYKGCRGFNESVLSRMRMILYSEPLKSKDMVERIRNKVDIKDAALLKQMADTVCEIQKYCRIEMIDGGVCGYREYEDWVWAYLTMKDIHKAAKRTIIAKAAPEAEDREEIYKTQILTRFPANQAEAA